MNNETSMKMIEKLLFLLSRKKAIALGKMLGGWGYYLFRKRRLLALQNLTLAFGEQYNETQRKKIVYNVFQHLGMTLIEFFRSKEITTENLSQFVTIHGRDILEKTYAQNKGVLGLSGHIGNWELMLNAIGLSGFKLVVISKSARQAFVNAYVTSHRTTPNITFLSGKKIIKTILKLLKSGAIIGIVLDQHAAPFESVVVPFFHKNASTFKSLAVLALKTGALVLPAYAYRDDNHHHHIVFEPPIPVLPGDTIKSCTLKYNQWLESVIRKYPTQWIWTHNRWK